MDNRNFTIDEILEREKFILVDTSAESAFHQDNDWFHKVAGANIYSQLSQVLLTDVIEGTQEFCEFLSHGNVYTTQGVSEEMARAAVLLRRKDKNLKQGTRRLPKDVRRKQNYRRLTDENPQKQRFISLVSVYDRLNRQIRRGVYTPNTGMPATAENRFAFDYDSLNTLVRDLSAAAGIKKDFRGRHTMFVPLNELKEETYTDEELVATAMYNAAVCSTPTAILTADSDIPKMLDLVVWCSAQAECEESGRLIETLEASPVRAYFIHKNSSANTSIELKTDTAEHIAMLRRSRRIKIIHLPANFEKIFDTVFGRQSPEEKQPYVLAR